MNGEINYLNVIENILRHGEVKQNRTGIDTLVVRPTFWEHDMSLGFPLLTTKKMAKKSILVELQGFIAGITSKKWYQDRGCKIWNEWCNPKCLPDTTDIKDHNDLSDRIGVFIRENGIDPDTYNYKLGRIYHECKDAKEAFKRTNQLFIDDLGPVYGYQWRRFNESYIDGCPTNEQIHPLFDLESCLSLGDQLSHLILMLKRNPNDRRMKVEAWNFKEQPRQALPACHTGFQISHSNGKLNLCFNMRSVDMFLGAPFNIASYAMLLLLICKEVDMEPGFLSATFNDCHIYENHIDQCKEQLSRAPKDLCTVDILNWNDIWSWNYTDVKFNNYTSHDKISAPVAV